MPFDFSTALLDKALRRAARAEREARRGRIERVRADALVGELARVIRLAFEAGATSTLFGLEGTLRHAIRGDLCLQGWRWSDADQMARDLLDEAFRRVRAKRPSWNEGQPEWVIHEGMLIERTRCIRCHKPLPEGHHKFCGHLCKSVHHDRLWRLREANEDTAVEMATRKT